MEILENRKEYLEDFIRLNEEWISAYFEIEEIDRDLAANPEMVINNGGFIFSLVENGIVIGVCALFHKGNGTYELARMAVSPKHQGNGYGSRLLDAAMAKAKDIKAKKVFLVSNTKLKNAIALYKKYGFVTVFEGQHPVYKRANITMEYPDL